MGIFGKVPSLSAYIETQIRPTVTNVNIKFSILIVQLLLLYIYLHLRYLIFVYGLTI